MSVLQETIDKITQPIRPLVDQVRRSLFGANNERLDFLMDSFHKLTSQQQTGVIVGFGAGLGILVVVIFALYFARVSALESELERGFVAIQDLRTQAARYKQAKSRFDRMVSDVQSKTQSLRPKPFFEKKANKVGVNIESLKEKTSTIGRDSPLAAYFDEVRIDFRMSKVSIPRMLKFMVEIERSDKTLILRDLKIRARYGDKLYFDAEANISGFKRL